MTLFKRLLPALVVAIILAVAVVVPIDGVLAASPKETVCESIGSAGCVENPARGSSVYSALQTVVNLLSLIVGTVAIIFIVIAGFKYVTANGDASKISSAKNTLIYTLVGIVIVGLAQIIVRIVVTETTQF